LLYPTELPGQQTDYSRALIETPVYSAMLTYVNTLRAKAEILRKQGYSYNLINQKLGISISTMSYWFKDKPFVPNDEVLKRIKNGHSNGIISHNRRVDEIQTLRQQGISEIGELTERDLWLLGLGIYIGEGSKTMERVRISNSDPAVIRLCIRWLKEVGNLSNKNFSIRIHLYPDNDVDESIRYWQNITGLRRSNFQNVTIDRRINKQLSHLGKLPYGTAHLTVLSLGDRDKGVRLLRRINGWIAGAEHQV
jgi:transcriptional regulator with XRE-family HTH domain